MYGSPQGQYKNIYPSTKIFFLYRIFFQYKNIYPSTKFFFQYKSIYPSTKTLIAQKYFLVHKYHIHPARFFLCCIAHPVKFPPKQDGRLQYWYFPVYKSREVPMLFPLLLLLVEHFCHSEEVQDWQWLRWFSHIAKSVDFNRKTTSTIALHVGKRYWLMMNNLW